MEYLEKFVPAFIKNIPTHMDFDGQKRAEKWFQIIIMVFGVVGFIWGYICQQFSQTMYILIAGFVISCFLTLPPWPMFRRKPLKWLKVKQETESESTNNAPTSSGPTHKQRRR
ncbi:signal peptidase complex subunit 1-like [Ylistrum balloti]|uniref:signal peptidase complex subunit 1-like n=1 Tax=Ylistrum balloti TaxID=509963 RepID=UPI0029058FA6|nr:signal peptidase complex subunit 1-like [Ylistrum balloti]